MPVLHNLECTKCGNLDSNAYVKSVTRLPKCTACGGKTEILWSGVTARASVHASERTVVWRHPKTGAVAYPPQNNVPMPERYRRAGYERVEFTSLHALDKFCAEKKLVNETASFDRSGHADDL